MIFFQILKGFFLFLLGFSLLLCIIPIGVHLTSTTEGYGIHFKFSFFSFSLLTPSTKKDSRKKKQSQTSHNKKNAAKKSAETKQKKPKQKKKTPTKDKKIKKEKKMNETSKDQSSTLEDTFAKIQTFLPLLLASLQMLGSHKRIQKCNLELVVGSSDPVEAVALYGQAHALLGTLWIPLDYALNMEEGSARVLLEFEETSPALYGEFLLTITIGQLLAVLVKLAFGSWKIFKSSAPQKTPSSSQ